MSRNLETLDQRISRLERERAAARKAVADKVRDEQAISGVRAANDSERRANQRAKYNVGGGL